MNASNHPGRSFAIIYSTRLVCIRRGGEFEAQSAERKCPYLVTKP